MLTQEEKDRTLTSLAKVKLGSILVPISKVEKSFQNNHLIVTSIGSCFMIGSTFKTCKVCCGTIGINNGAPRCYSCIDWFPFECSDNNDLDEAFDTLLKELI